MKFRYLVFVVVLVVVAGVGFAFWRGSGPLPDPEGCSVTLNGHQVDLSTEQAENATLIAAIGIRRGLPARAVSIALATAIQESKLSNLDHGDRDSLGLFQQRPSMGWGTAKQVQDPYYATNAFYDALVKVADYETMPITQAAQKVQRSAFPDAYGAHEIDARSLASVLTGYSQGGLFTCVVHDSSARGSGDKVIRQVERAFGNLDIKRTGSRQDVALTVDDSEAGRRLGWSVSQFVLAHGVRLHPQRIAYSGKQWHVGRASEDGWKSGGGEGPTRVRVSMG
jgi:hypothetical protein